MSTSKTFTPESLEALRAAARRYVLSGGGVVADDQTRVVEAVSVAASHLGVSEDTLRTMVTANVRDGREADEILSKAMNLGYDFGEVGFAFGVQVGLIIAGAAR